MQVKDKKTNARSYALIGALMLIIMFQVQNPVAWVILLMVGAPLLGTGGYHWLQEFRRERELSKYENAA